MSFMQSIYDEIRVWWTAFHDAHNIAPVLSALAILLTALSLWQSSNREKVRLARKHMAEKATLPLLLSSLSEYTNEVFVGLNALFQHAKKNAIDKASTSFHPPMLPAELTEQIKAMIEASNSAKVRKRLIDVISTIQLINARLTTLEQSFGDPSYALTTHEIESHIIDNASLLALVNSMFKYARRETKNIEPYNFGSLRGAVRELFFGAYDLGGVTLESINVTLQRREANGEDPFVFNPSESAWPRKAFSRFRFHIRQTLAKHKSKLINAEVKTEGKN